jgi:hypothetical protein
MKTLLLTGAIWLPSLPVLTKYLPLPLVLFHALLTLAGVTLWLRGWPKLSSGGDGAITALLYGVVVVAFVVGYPLAESGGLGGGSDRDDAIERATAALLDGRYPYYQRTNLDKEISPLPGSLVLAIPFALANVVPAQSLLWLGGWFLFVLTRGPAIPAVALVTLGSPAVLHDVVTGGDLVANSLYVLGAILAVTEASSRYRWPGYVFAGVALSSRPTFWLVLPPLAVYFARTGRGAREPIVAIVLVSAMVTLPFYLWDPAAFTPLHVAGKLAGARSLFPNGDWVLVVTATGLVLAASRRVSGELRTLLEVQGFALWIPPILASGAMLLISDYRWADFLYFALPAGFWATTRARTERAS